ncbi:signal peptidase I [Evansella halocellulosilytica]|uniref:signal peptidase I n=1 Tax=Evansella halocellulosilytica TaxID=2011013 RepID=UPI0015C7039B|nr:signal peptidase I [Evansella halocellulosilytica]
MIKKVMKWISNLFVVFFLILSLGVLVTNVQAKGEPPSIFGFQLLQVLTGSMEPHLNPGDIVVIKKDNGIQVNDVITYKNPENIYVTHRVVDVVEKNNEILFQTRGDANNIVDQDFVSSDQLLGSYVFSIPKIGYIINIAKNPIGIFLLSMILIILLIFGTVKKIILRNHESNDKVNT